MRFWGRKKPEDKVVALCPKCRGAKGFNRSEDGHFKFNRRCAVCNGMGVGLVSRSKIKELNLASLE